MSVPKAGAGTLHGAKFWECGTRDGRGYKMLQQLGWAEGQGLGKGKAGRNECLKEKRRGADDRSGIGSTKTTGAAVDEMWMAATDVFNSVLSKLNKKAEEAKVGADETGEASSSDDDAAVGASIQRSIGKRQLYARFKRGKDISRASASDLAALIGTPTGPARADTEAHENGEYHPGDSLVTKVNPLSMADYFSQKIVAIKERPQPVKKKGFTEDFQEAYYNQMMGVSEGRTGKGGLGFGADCSSSSGAEEPTNAKCNSNDVSKKRPLIDGPIAARVVDEKVKKVRKSMESPIVACRRSPRIAALKHNLDHGMETGQAWTLGDAALVNRETNKVSSVKIKTEKGEERYNRNGDHCSNSKKVKKSKSNDDRNDKSDSSNKDKVERSKQKKDSSKEKSTKKDKKKERKKSRENDEKSRKKQKK